MGQGRARFKQVRQGMSWGKRDSRGHLAAQLGGGSGDVGRQHRQLPRLRKGVHLPLPRRRILLPMHAQLPARGSMIESSGQR